MTLDEAIKHCEEEAEEAKRMPHIKGGLIEKCSQDFRQLAEWLKELKALKAEPCEDAISRESAIQWVKTECNPYGKPTLDFESGKNVIEHLKQMPSVTSKQKTGEWIELKDHKPEAYEDVLVRDIDGDVRCAHMLDESISGISFYEAFGGECIENVVEWREIL